MDRHQHGPHPRALSPRPTLRSPVPHGHWKTTTLVAGLRLSGIAAPFVLDGPINRYAFQVYVDEVLVPELAPGDIVIMDKVYLSRSLRLIRRRRSRITIAEKSEAFRRALTEPETQVVPRRTSVIRRQSPRSTLPEMPLRPAS